MSQVSVVDAAGKSAGTVELPASVFDVTANVPLIHQVVVAQLAAARQGTHKTKGRGEVSGSGRKPFKQKGTGRARQGSVRMPQHKGGGIVHGPVPRDYSQRTPKKMIHLALLGAISDRARAGRLHVVTSFVPGDAPSTKTAAKLVTDLTVGPRVLVVVEPNDTVTEKSVRNLIGVHTITPGQLNAYDVLHADDIMFTKAAYESFVSAKTTKEVSA
jgi:large subunit ribosomal protein L4